MPIVHPDLGPGDLTRGATAPPPFTHGSTAGTTAVALPEVSTDPVGSPSAAPRHPATTEERRAALEAIAAEVSVCRRCPLSIGRTNAVPGEGHPDTEVMFVGEGPGFNEDQQGRPFVGAAGRFLDELIASVGWKRHEVYITNVVKCRPPGNRDPEPAEIAACAPYLRRQLEVLDPALIVTLGRFSMQTFMPGARIGQVHGTVRPVDAETGARDAQVYAMYHPASAFRQLALRQTIQLDMTGVPAALVDARERRAAARDTGSTVSAPTAPDTVKAAAPATGTAGVTTTATGTAEAPVATAVAPAAAIDTPPDPIPAPQDAPSAVPIDQPLPRPTPVPGEPEPAPPPIDEPLPGPGPDVPELPGPLPAGAAPDAPAWSETGTVATTGLDQDAPVDGQLGLFA